MPERRRAANVAGVTSTFSCGCCEIAVASAAPKSSTRSYATRFAGSLSSQAPNSAYAASSASGELSRTCQATASSRRRFGRALMFWRPSSHRVCFSDCQTPRQWLRPSREVSPRGQTALALHFSHASRAPTNDAGRYACASPPYAAKSPAPLRLPDGIDPRICAYKRHAGIAATVPSGQGAPVQAFAGPPARRRLKAHRTPRYPPALYIVIGPIPSLACARARSRR